ncbi:MAG TPA: hypothetical protein VFZ65_03160 [Planctomycetota bacterium]|nr:hypothetical protein [Planctomycetota bacterium]
MYPHERSLVEEWKDEPFALVGVNSDQTLARAKQAILRNQLTWRSFQNKPEGQATAIADDWAVHGWPTIVVLDGERTIRYRGHDGGEATKVARSLLEAK